MLNLETAKVSLLGNRSNNQDRCAVFSANNTYFLVLADGLGGHPKGEVAAQTLINVCQQMFSRELKPIQAPERFMHTCVQQAHQAIIDYGKRQRPPITPRTTAVLSIIQNGMCYWAHVGDSRFYLIRNGTIAAQTRDHSLVQLINTLPEYAAEQFQDVNRNSITRCLGGETATPVPTLGSPTSLFEGDYLVLCSDGLWGQVEEDELLGGLDISGTLRRKITKLAEYAQKNGQAKSDNVTACVLHWPEVPELTRQIADTDLDAAVNHLASLIQP